MFVLFISGKVAYMPKGYNDKAIAGALMFVQGCFEVVMAEVKRGKPVEQVLQEELDEIREKLEADKVKG